MNENISENLEETLRNHREHQERKEKRKKNWKKFLEIITAILFWTVGTVSVLLMVDMIGECATRNIFIRSVEPVVVTGVYDNSVPQYSDGKTIRSEQYLYFLDFVDTTGAAHRHQVDHWSPWLSWNDSIYIHEGDTVNLYRFSSGGILGIKGTRLVFEKNGRFYE